MSSIGEKQLIFRLGGVGFLISIDSVVEVVDQIEGALDPERSDVGRGIVTALFFRQTWIPVVDPSLKLGLFSDVKLRDRVAVVLKGDEGNWAILVEQIKELSPERPCVACDIPFLLKVSAFESYTELKLVDGEPLVVFDPERFFGAGEVQP